MGAPQYEQAGADVAGSGTTGTIPVWSSGTTLTDSPLTVSGSNVTGAGAIRATGTSATAPAFTGSDTDTGMYFPANNQVRFSTNGTVAVAVDASQNVGIQNANPSYPLHVGAGNNTGIVTTGPAAYIATNGTTSLVVRDATNGIESFVFAGSGVVLAGAASNHPYHIRTNNQTRILVTATGDVGIGTTSPTDRVTVNGGGLAITGNVSGATTTANTVLVDNIGGTTRVFSIGPNASTNGSYNFYIGKSGGSPGYASAIAVDTTGNVGIGTANPSAKLEVSDGANGRFRFAGPLGTAAYADVDNFIFRSSNAGLTFGTFNGSRLDISTTTGYGLKLPGTNGTTYNTDPNTLDCYAEKDLTATMTPGTSGTITLSSSTLKFTRIGRVVTIVGRLVIGSVSSPVGRLAINTGVGANEYPGTYAAAAVFPNGWQAGFTGAPVAVAIPASATVYLDRFTTGGVGIDVASYAQAGAEVSISITYVL